MKKTTLLTTLAVSILAHTVHADTYVIDKAHSSVGFQVRHLFSKVPGKFTDFSGRIQFDEAKPEQSSVDVSIKTASVNTSNEARDKDLRSDHFFDAEKFPEITFKSKSIKTTGANTGEITGDLTMHGVTKEVVLQAALLGKGKGMQGKVVSGWDATTTIKRTEFGLAWNQVIEGTQVVGEEVQVELHLEADQER